MRIYKAVKSLLEEDVVLYYVLLMLLKPIFHFVRFLHWRAQQVKQRTAPISKTIKVMEIELSVVDAYISNFAV